MGMRVEDGGESECCSVMERIGIESKGNIIPPEREQTSAWSLVTREFVEP
jgi:hypothetical protein